MKYLTIFFLLILTSLANAAPSVTWSPRSVVRTVSPGLAVVENVSFRSSADLANVRLRVLPALASLVTVIPSKLRVVHKHQDISVRLSITIPSGFPINNVLNGGIQVRVDNDNDTACGDGERAVREKEDLSTNGEQQRRCVLPVTLDIVRSSYRESDVGKIIKNANGSVFPSNELILTLTGDLGTADAQALASTVGGEVVGVAQSSKSYQVIVPTSTEQELNELISTLGAETGVASVLKNYVGTLFGAVTDLENLRSCNPTRDWPSAYDKIHAPEAWNFLESAPPGTTLNPITVGVIDSGLNRVHPEFASNVSLNPSGVPNEIDTVGHGTLVAGIIGANNLGITANCSTTDAQESGLQMNGIVSGVPGITYSLETRGSALPTWLKTLSLIDDLGSLRTANGTPRVPIINISLGYTECTISLFFSKSCILPLEFEIITHLFAVHVQSLPDILFITAAGEDDIDSANVTPANLGNVASTTNVLTVGATDPLDLRLSFASGTLRIVSNWGSTVGLSAPGFHVYGFVLGNSYSGGGRGSTFSSEGGIGNSFSAPLVTGAAAILKALQPRLSPVSLKNILISSADPITTDKPIGPRLNILRAVQQALAPPGRMDDNFNDNSLNTGLWFVTIVPAGVGTISETNQQLEMTKISSGNGYMGLASKCKVAGNFDVQVDYKLLNWPAQNFHTVRLMASDLPDGGTGFPGVYRNSYADENYQFRNQLGLAGLVSVPTSDTSGTIGLRRKDSTLSGFGPHGTIGSALTTLDTTGFTIDFATPSTTAPGNVAIAFDNFKVNAGTVVCPQ